MSIKKKIKTKRSAGCIIYEIVNLQKAFKGDSPKEILDAILYKPVNRLKFSLNLEPILDL